MYFPPRIFPGFLGPEALKLSVTPARQAELVFLFQQRKIAYCGSRAVTALAQVWGRAAPSVPSPSIVGSELKCPITIEVHYVPQSFSTSPGLPSPPRQAGNPGTGCAITPSHPK